MVEETVETAASGQRLVFRTPPNPAELLGSYPRMKLLETIPDIPEVRIDPKMLGRSNEK